VSHRVEPAGAAPRGCDPTRPRTGGGALVTSYSPVDPLRLSPEVLEILAYFDGRTTRAARQAITRELGYEADTALLLKLVDFGVLVDAENGE
jgi:hypothetical protein